MTPFLLLVCRMCSTSFCSAVVLSEEKLYDSHPAGTDMRLHNKSGRSSTDAMYGEEK